MVFRFHRGVSPVAILRSALLVCPCGGKEEFGFHIFGGGKNLGGKIFASFFGKNFEGKKKLHKKSKRFLCKKGAI